MSVLDRTGVLMSLIQVIQMGIKRHFRAAHFTEPTLSGTGNWAQFSVTVLGKQFRVTVQDGGTGAGG